LPVLRHGRQYLRPVSFLGLPFATRGPGELVAWSRILDDEEVLCVVNSHGTDARGADVIIDAGLNPPGSVMTVLVNTMQAAQPQALGTHAAGSVLPVRRSGDGTAYVEIRDVPPSEVLVLGNHPDGAVAPELR
jgi:hypothetical protein